MSHNNHKDAQQVLDFWYGLNPAQWFKNDTDLDNQIRGQFFEIWQQAAAGELSLWRNTLEGRLAEIIVLDQFSRNLFRGQARAFARDEMALVLSQEALRHDDYSELSKDRAKFLIMPFMHSESKVIQAQSVKLFKNLGDKNSLDFAEQHKAIIDQFGRYPHRNQALGRESTAQEKEFLKQPGSSF
ncbi:MAG: DUF924 domain-containing protein [Proteobacteria bacterium]|nr:DUF924 domain-containing protein [Pseudomonadota bacterium]